ncbi:MAG: hypothetical protein K5931_01395 [Lachnospiraceae bacterium]|nr:hypothetical protein [Lachnospiraceae bacterium]
MFFPIFTTVLIVFGLFKIYIRMSGKKVDNSAKDFLERESRANGVRRQPLTDIKYIELDLSMLPIDLDTDDEELKAYQDKVVSMEGKKISNLSSYTNTDLKFKYGPANLDYLTQCDQNFLELVRELYRWGDYLYKKGELEKAVKVLEYGVTIHSDVKSNYKLLADIYANSFDFASIDRITKEAEKIESPNRDSIIEMLKCTDYFKEAPL